MDLYNSSSDPNVMRNVSVVFLDEKGIAKKCTPRDDDTKRRINQQFVQNSFERFDLEPINVPPKTVRKCRLINNFSARNDGLDFIWNTVKIELEYTNKNNKTKRILIRQHDYSETFLETHRRTN